MVLTGVAIPGQGPANWWAIGGDKGEYGRIKQIKAIQAGLDKMRTRINQELAQEYKTTYAQPIGPDNSYEIEVIKQSRFIGGLFGNRAGGGFTPIDRDNVYAFWTDKAYHGHSLVGDFIKDQRLTKLTENGRITVVWNIRTLTVHSMTYEVKVKRANHDQDEYALSSRNFSGYPYRAMYFDGTLAQYQDAIARLLQDPYILNNYPDKYAFLVNEEGRAFIRQAWPYMGDVCEWTPPMIGVKNDSHLVRCDSIFNTVYNKAFNTFQYPASAEEALAMEDVFHIRFRREVNLRLKHDYITNRMKCDIAFQGNPLNIAAEYHIKANGITVDMFMPKLCADSLILRNYGYNS